MLAQELFKGYDKKMGPKRVDVKVDIQKAYDIVNWQFLESILNGFGLHYKMVQWIMRCVLTSSFSICINGQSCGYFKGGRGLRQGDSISPYLFTLVMEILTLIIKRKSSVSVLKDSIDEFGKVTWIIPNYNKSTIIFGCLNDEEKKELLDIMPFKDENLPIKYLGVPLTSKRLRAKELFLLPVGVIKDINKLLKNFLWQQNDGSKGRAKGWKNLLNQRKDVKKFIFSKLRDGNSTLVWYDNWSNIGTLDQVINHRALYDVRLSARLTVKYLMGQSNWDWPVGWIDKFPVLLSMQKPKLEEHLRDNVLWRRRDGNLCKFSVKQAYLDLLEDTEDVVWWKMIWFSQNIPKHDFILWMAVLNKLATQDKIKHWSSFDVMRCSLCKKDTDSHSHLFFKCEFSKTLWDKERNYRIFKDKLRSPDELHRTFETFKYVMPKKLLGYGNPSLEDLPDDIMLDILSRLPVKSMAYSKSFPRILSIRSGLGQWLICMWEVGDDGDEGEHKVIQILCQSKKIKVEVYTLGTNQWRSLELPDYINLRHCTNHGFDDEAITLGFVDSGSKVTNLMEGFISSYWCLIEKESYVTEYRKPQILEICIVMVVTSIKYLPYDGWDIICH
ncbi:RNA-directed DNA polymerase, eukaryota, reverse transcriptase zinc-binding domain protein [Tanacetum coccineum]